jgi:hypothetical protein
VLCLVVSALCPCLMSVTRAILCAAVLLTGLRMHSAPSLALLPALHSSSDFAGLGYTPRPCLCVFALGLALFLCPCLRARRLVSACTRPREPLLSREFTHN